MKPYLNFLYALTGIAFSAASFAASLARKPPIAASSWAAAPWSTTARSSATCCAPPGAAAAATTQHHHQLRPAGDGRAAPIRRRWQRQSPGQQPARRDAAGQPGLGLAAGRNLGAFVLRWRRDTATLDGSPARLIVSSDGGATWRELDADAAPDANDLIAWTRDAQRRPSSAARSPSACGSRRPSRRPPRCTWAARSSSTVP